MKIKHKKGGVTAKDQQAIIQEGSVIEYVDENGDYGADIGYRDFYGTSMYYIMFNAKMVHSSKTYKSMLRKLNQLKEDYNLEYRGVQYAKGGQTNYEGAEITGMYNEYGSAYQDEVEDAVRDLTSEQYEAFCYDYNVDPNNANEMSDFIANLDQEEAEDIMTHIRTTGELEDRMKGMGYAKGGKIDKDIAKFKKQLIAKEKSRGLYENFGRNEVRKIKEKYDAYEIGDDGVKNYVKMQEFSDWASGFDGTRYAKGGKTDTPSELKSFSKKDIKEVNSYLNELRDSGQVNMFGATPYLVNEFFITKSQAKALLVNWMKNYAKGGEISKMEWIDLTNQLEGYEDVRRATGSLSPRQLMYEESLLEEFDWRRENDFEDMNYEEMKQAATLNKENYPETYKRVMGYAKGGEVDYGKARRRLESLGLSTDAGDRNVIIDEVRDGFGIDCSEVIRASSDDDVYVAVDGLLQDYGAYAQQDEEYAKGGKTKKKMWLAKERGGEEFVLEAPNKKEAEEDASMYGGYIVREIKNFKENPDGSVEYAKGGEVDVYGSVDEKDWDKYKDNIMGYSIDETNYHDNPRIGGQYNINIRIEKKDLEKLQGYMDIMETQEVQYAKGGEVGKTYQIKGADVTFYEDSYEEGEQEQFHSYYLGENDFPYKTEFSSKKDLFDTLNDFVSYADMKEEDFYVDEDTIQTSALVKYKKDSDWDEFSAPTEKEKELWKEGKMKLYSAQFVFPYEVYKKEKLEFSKGGKIKMYDELEEYEKDAQIGDEISVGYNTTKPEYEVVGKNPDGTIKVRNYGSKAKKTYFTFSPQSYDEQVMVFSKGGIVRISEDNDNDNYDDYRGKDLRIVSVAYDTSEHQGYDESMDGMGLYDLEVAETGEEVPFSLYEYEVEEFAKGGLTRRGKVLSEDELWDMIESYNWDENKYNWKDSGIIKQVNKLPKNKYKQIRGFVQAKVDNLNTKYEKDWLADPGIEVSDDGWWDVRAEVVGRGKKFYNNISVKKLQNIADTGDYKENFQYIFQDHKNWDDYGSSDDIVKYEEIWY